MHMPSVFAPADVVLTHATMDPNTKSVTKNARNAMYGCDLASAKTSEAVTLFSKTCSIYYSGVLRIYGSLKRCTV